MIFRMLISRIHEKMFSQFGEGENIVEVWEEEGYDVWLEQWIEDWVDESTGESTPIQRHELHRSPIEESPWRKEEENDETGSTRRGDRRNTGRV